MSNRMLPAHLDFVGCLCFIRQQLHSAVLLTHTHITNSAHSHIHTLRVVLIHTYTYYGQCSFMHTHITGSDHSHIHILQIILIHTLQIMLLHTLQIMLIHTYTQNGQCSFTHTHITEIKNVTTTQQRDNYYTQLKIIIKHHKNKNCYNSSTHKSLLYTT